MQLNKMFGIQNFFALPARGTFFCSVMLVCSTLSGLPNQVLAQQTPAPATAEQRVAADKFVKTVTDDVLALIRQNKQVLTTDPKKLNEFVDTKVLPYINFRKMTAQVVGRPWREATPEQRNRLIEEFRTLLVRTYAGALAQVKDQQIEVRPLRAGPNDDDVIVQSFVTRSKGEPIALDYRLERSGDQWKIYDVNVAGLWLVETYRTQFGAEINKSGIDGLIKTLSERNKAS